MEPVIRLSDVTVRFGSQKALDRVSLEVPSGHVFALLGENGAGKTTAIRILLGLLTADAGVARVLGFDSARDGLEIRRRVGYVPERPTLYEWMTVSEIGWFAAGFYEDGFLAKYNELIEEFELPRDRKLKALSKGMRAKIALSLAMAHEPGLLVLDEPTSGLDPMVRRAFLESMVDVAGSGRTVLLSSHQISEVERVADVVAILRQGKLVVVERLDQLKKHVRELTITLEDTAGELPALEVEVLSQRRQGRQCRLLVRGLEEGQETRLRSQAAVTSVESRAPDLEEIFVAYMQPGSSSDGGTEPRSPSRPTAEVSP